MQPLEMKKTVVIAGLLLLTVGTRLNASAQRLERLEIFEEEYPRAGYFRVAESCIRKFYNGLDQKYDDWSRRMAELSGIMGKTEYEELL